MGNEWLVYKCDWCNKTIMLNSDEVGHRSTPKLCPYCSTTMPMYKVNSFRLECMINENS